MLTSTEIYITDVTELFTDLYRFGNASTARLDHIRHMKDALIVKDGKGIEYIMADGNGVSAFSAVGAGKKNTWKIPKGTMLPKGIILVKDRRQGHENHYMLAPEQTMPLVTFCQLMQSLQQYAIKIS